MELTVRAPELKIGDLLNEVPVSPHGGFVQGTVLAVFSIHKDTTEVWYDVVERNLSHPTCVALKRMEKVLYYNHTEIPIHRIS